MPVSKYFKGHGDEVMANMKKQYGDKKGEQVFYATANKKKETANEDITAPGADSPDDIEESTMAQDPLIEAAVKELASQPLVEAFTRQHYVMIAQCIKELKDDLADVATDVHVKRLVDNLMAMFKADNPGFDKTRFAKACGF